MDKRKSHKRSYRATIEYFPDRRAAIVTLTTARGDWSSAKRVELPRWATSSKEWLYSMGYIHASRTAHSKGGILDAFEVIKGAA